jgi:adenosylcobyric acid synthase
VLAFPYLANFTDFDTLAAEPSVSLAYVRQPEELQQADLLILPGSKQTLNDLQWLRRNGFEPAVRSFAARACVMGICGGMQMLGVSIEDAEGSENRGVPQSEAGLALLPIATTLRAEKVTRTTQGQLASAALFGQPLQERRFQGYEIHLGETLYRDGAQPFAQIQRGTEEVMRADGAVDAGGRVFGTYIHGLFTDDRFRHSFLDAARASCGLEPAQSTLFVTRDRERRLDRLADHVRSSLDMELIWRCLGVRP